MAEQQTTEAAKNCAGCNKPVKKKRRYYRNGKYYCSQNCWRKAKDKAAEELKGAAAAEKPAEPAAKAEEKKPAPASEKPAGQVKTEKESS